MTEERRRTDVLPLVLAAVAGADLVGAGATLALGGLAFVAPLALQGTAFPFRLHEAASAFAAGALSTTLFLGFAPLKPREWWLAGPAALGVAALGVAAQGNF